MKKLLVALFFVCVLMTIFGCSKAQSQKTFYDITLDYSAETHTAKCSESVMYFNSTSENLTYVDFNLYPSAFREESEQKVVSQAQVSKAYPKGLSYGGIEIFDVKTNENDGAFEITGEDENILRVFCEVFPQNLIEIEINFLIKLPNINHRFGYGENTVNFGNFYPIVCVFDDGFVHHHYTANGDPFYSDVSNYSVKISYPENFTLACTGEVEMTKTGEKKTSTIKANDVRDFAFVLSNKFEVLEESVGETEVKYFYYQDPSPQKSLETAVKAIKTFSKLFGEYPYKTFSVVEANFVYGGMEYPNLVLISDEITQEQDYQYVIVHETAHQWWYGVVGNDEFNEAWLDESLTEYSCALFYEDNPDFGVEYKKVISDATESYKHFVRVFSSIYRDLDLSMQRSLDEFGTEPEYVNLIYTKGIILFDDVRKSIKDRKFFRALKEYYKENFLKNATAKDLVNQFEKTSKTSVGNLIESYLQGNEVVL